MSHFIRALSLVAISLVLASASAEEPGPALAPREGREGIVLLRNGQVLYGKIARTGDQYVVSLASGEIRLKADAVEHICRDLEEGYQRKHDDIEQGKVQDRLELVQWCIRHDLFGYAASELSEAIAADPTHPRIALVERQLTLARERPLPVVRSAAEMDATPSNDDLDRLLRGMPTGTVETFSNTVQPLLLNTCTAAGCHGPQSENGLRLLRIPLGKTPSRRLTQRNLYAVLATIDRSDPAASPLLTAPIAAHGTAKAAIFTNREVVQYKHLVDWVHRVASKPPEPASQPATVDRPNQNLLQNMPTAAPLADRKSTELLKREAAAGGEGRPDVPKSAGDAAPQRAKNGDADRSAGRPPAPIDEFDPEIFNRQFAPPK